MEKNANYNLGIEQVIVGFILGQSRGISGPSRVIPYSPPPLYMGGEVE